MTPHDGGEGSLFMRVGFGFYHNLLFRKVFNPIPVGVGGGALNMLLLS